MKAFITGLIIAIIFVVTIYGLGLLTQYFYGLFNELPVCYGSFTYNFFGVLIYSGMGVGILFLLFLAIFGIYSFGNGILTIIDMWLDDDS